MYRYPVKATISFRRLAKANKSELTLAAQLLSSVGLF
jgi:hypothetical protein